MSDRLTNHSAPREKDQVVAWHLSRCSIFRDYQSAFERVTRQPLLLSGLVGDLPSYSSPHANIPPASMLGLSRAMREACLRAQQHGHCHRNAPPSERITLTESGAVETAIPVLMGHEPVAWLRTGASTKTARRSDEARSNDPGLIRLLEVFARHLGVLCNQIILQPKGEEPTAVQRARHFIHQRYRDDLSLPQVSAAAGANMFSFCHQFRRTTGLTFKDYLARLRLEKSKPLLLNPNVRIKEVAFAAGFTTAESFNRVFRELGGQSPTEFRRNGELVPCGEPEDETIIGSDRSNSSHSWANEGKSNGARNGLLMEDLRR